MGSALARAHALKAAMIAAIVLGCVAWSGAHDLGAAPRFSNLQVMPEDANAGEVFRVMKLMTRGLGTDCRACHRNDVRDFATDATPFKNAAREMMRLEIKRRGSVDWRAPPLDLCVGCHKGKIWPEQKDKSD